MKSEGTELVRLKVASLSMPQQFEYWRDGGASLRRQMKSLSPQDFQAELLNEEQGRVEIEISSQLPFDEHRRNIRNRLDKADTL